MIQIKKTILTLALLLTAATGARADELQTSYTSSATLNNVTVSASMEVTIASGVTVTINNGLNITSGTLTVTGPGTLVVTGANGNDGGDGEDEGGPGGTGGAAISGNIIVQGGANVTANGGTGGKGGYGNESGGTGGTGGAAISGNIIVQGGATVTATGGNGGNGGNTDCYGGNGGNGGNAFAGTLTYKSGTVTANGGSGGSGATGDVENGSNGSAGNAFANDNDVDFKATGYSVTNGTSTIESVEDQTKVVISGGTPIPDAPAGTTVDITWNAATPNTATIASMPAGNVEVSVDYFAQAEFAMSTGTTPVALAPAAIADVPANTDDPIVTAGTVANIGTSEVKQGTLMYFVKQSTGNTAPDAPGYDTEGWTDKVPTANGLAEGNAYVWYYIKGAEPANIADRTDDNTRSDSDIKALGTTGFVTIAAEPTYNVTLNAEGLSDEEAAAWKVAKGTDDPAAFPLEGVKKAETVKVTYSGSKKVIGVKAEKKAPEPATVTTAPTAKTVVKAGQNEAIVNAGTAEGGTMMYKVTTANTKPTSTDGFSATVPTAEGLTAGTYYVWYYVKADDSHTDSEIAATAIEVPVADIVWDNTNVFKEDNQNDLLNKWNTTPLNYEGIKISFSGSGTASGFCPYNGGVAYLRCYGDSFTFTAPSGKQFTKIVITDNAGVTFTDYGDWKHNTDAKTGTWSGTPSNTVTLGSSSNIAFNDLKSIAFILVDAE